LNLLFHFSKRDVKWTWIFYSLQTLEVAISFNGKILDENSVKAGSIPLPNPSSFIIENNDNLGCQIKHTIETLENGLIIGLIPGKG